MRAVKMVFTGTLAMVAVGLFACGSSSSTTVGPVDSGTAPGADSSTDSAVGADSAALDAGQLACVIDADLTTLAPPDAALNDAGASVGTCVGCARKNCGTQIVNCNADCTCNNVFDCLFTCLGGVGGTLVYCYTAQCGGELPLGGSTTNANQAEIKLLECAAQSCAADCDACSLYPGLCKTPTDASAPSDGSTPADSATDAPADATGE